MGFSEQQNILSLCCLWYFFLLACPFELVGINGLRVLFFPFICLIFRKVFSIIGTDSLIQIFAFFRSISFLLVRKEVSMFKLFSLVLCFSFVEQNKIVLAHISSNNHVLGMAGVERFHLVLVTHKFNVDAAVFRVDFVATSRNSDLNLAFKKRNPIVWSHQVQGGKGGENDDFLMITENIKHAIGFLEDNQLGTAWVIHWTSINLFIICYAKLICLFIFRFIAYLRQYWTANP